MASQSPAFNWRVVNNHYVGPGLVLNEVHKMRDRTSSFSAEALRRGQSLDLGPHCLTMRQPPKSVANPIAAWQANTTQKGT